MKVLFLAHKPPFPLTDGYNLHNYHHARQLAARHELHMVAIGSPTPAAELAGIFRAVHLFPRRVQAPKPAGVGRALRSLSVHEVFEFDPYVQQGILELEPRSFDVVWSGGIKMLVYSSRIEGVPVLGDVADDETGPARDRVRMARSPGALLRALRDLSKISRYQRTYFRHLDVCTVVSERDRDAIRASAPDLDVRVVPNGVDHDYFAPLAAPQRPASVVFEGNMGFGPNVEGVHHFAREILPRIASAEPRVHFTVVGKDPVDSVRKLGGERIEVTGLVDDVRPYVARAAVFVCPLISGTGIKNKILQAWSMGKAVVATPDSVGGLRIEPGLNIVVADSPAKFARAVLDLFADGARALEIGRRARETVLAHYTWAQTSAQMETALTAAANRRRERATA